MVTGSGATVERMMPCGEKCPYGTFSGKVAPRNPSVVTAFKQATPLSSEGFTVRQAFDIFDWVHSGIVFVKKPTPSQIARPSETLQARAGGCDDLAVLTTSLIRCAGGNARVVVTYTENECSAFSEVLIGREGSVQGIADALGDRYFDSAFNQIHYEIDPDGKEWLLFDTSLQYPGAFPRMATKMSRGWRWDRNVTRLYINFVPKAKGFRIETQRRRSV